MSLHLCKDLLNLAQLENNEFTFECERFDLSRTVRMTLKMLSYQAGQRGVKLEGPIYPNPFDRPLFRAINSDVQRITQLIVNFASNGIKFTPEYGKVSVILQITDIQYERVASDDESEGTPSESKLFPTVESCPLEHEEEEKGPREDLPA